MKHRIYPIKLGINHCYLIEGDGLIMVDGGSGDNIDGFVNELKRININPKAIKLIVLTHGHWDHIGCVEKLKELTNAKVLLHYSEKDFLEKSLIGIPMKKNLIGKLLGKMASKIISKKVNIPSTKVDIVLNNEEFSLKEYGISGKIIHTPGHSSGSISIVLESGEAFVGDMILNPKSYFLTKLNSEDVPCLKQSWKKLLERNITMVYPSHSAPFPVELIANKI